MEHILSRKLGYNKVQCSLPNYTADILKPDISWEITTLAMNAYDTVIEWQQPGREIAKIQLHMYKSNTW